jgi:hypothetical protein
MARFDATRPVAARIGRDLRARLLATFVALGLMGLLGLAAYLKPSPTGVGTHLQLGMYQCGWLMSLGKPCPTCGMTTAFAHAAHGHPLASFLAQPMGAVLAVGCSAGFWAALHVAATGSRVGVLCGTLLRPRVMWPVAAAALLAWAYKVYSYSPPAG